MAKFEEVTTFNLDNKTYAVANLSTEAKDLLRVYLETEEDVTKFKIALVKSQHALSSMGNMFRDMIKDVESLPLEEIQKRQAAEVLAAARMAEEPANDPEPALKKKPAPRRK
jgi:septal ring factor EnvC (AmiA/AmiB activator)